MMCVKQASLSVVVAFASCVAAAASFAADFELPPEITPKVRAACEADVRRHCVDENSTQDKVRSCVMANYMKFGRRCKMEAAMAGLISASF